MFGTIAGAIQLTDVALRASRDAYGFLTAIKGAKADVQDLRRTLRDVEANVRNLRSFLAKFAKSKLALEEYEVLPETVRNTLAQFYDDILDLKSLLPPKASPDLAQRVKWAYSKSKVKNLTNRFHECESHLLTALSIV
ncbi:hypothetical protein BS50DRAFT_479899 [Corynespora cassiicola Philippines]|uniref:Fungal N-terminal domain-containing protein n=1 Tax=Corynespora cassiicola Philippines TaxID=1448308 RepID=A0A2T2P876_CORCC|nr:hypothetical protein BS50DRAFT_479899 [Corynespora cassiicola Philippines]